MDIKAFLNVWSYSCINHLCCICFLMLSHIHNSWSRNNMSELSFNNTAAVWQCTGQKNSPQYRSWHRAPGCCAFTTVTTPSIRLHSTGSSETMIGQQSISRRTPDSWSCITPHPGKIILPFFSFSKLNSLAPFSSSEQLAFFIVKKKKTSELQH